MIQRLERACFLVCSHHNQTAESNLGGGRRVRALAAALTPTTRSRFLHSLRCTVSRIPKGQGATGHGQALGRHAFCPGPGGRPAGMQEHKHPEQRTYPLVPSPSLPGRSKQRLVHHRRCLPACSPSWSWVGSLANSKSAGARARAPPICWTCMWCSRRSCTAAAGRPTGGKVRLGT